MYPGKAREGGGGAESERGEKKKAKKQETISEMVGHFFFFLLLFLSLLFFSDLCRIWPHVWWSGDPFPNEINKNTKLWELTRSLAWRERKRQVGEKKGGRGEREMEGREEKE